MNKIRSLSTVTALLLAGSVTVSSYAGDLSQTPRARAERQLAESLNDKCWGGKRG